MGKFRFLLGVFIFNGDCEVLFFGVFLQVWIISRRNFGGFLGYSLDYVLLLC